MNIFAKKLFTSPLWVIALAASVLSFASCTKDDDEDDKVDEDVVTAETFMGKMTVAFMGSDQVTDSVKIDIANVVYSDADKTEGTLDIELNQVKFVSQMPVSLDIIVPGVSFKVTGENMAEISGEGIIPTTGGVEYEMYKVSGLTGTITNEDLSDKTDDAIQFSLKFGEFPVSYSGSFVDNSI
jgi:hypothetical protein